MSESTPETPPSQPRAKTRCSLLCDDPVECASGEKTELPRQRREVEETVPQDSGLRPRCEPLTDFLRVGSPEVASATEASSPCPQIPEDECSHEADSIEEAGIDAVMDKMSSLMSLVDAQLARPTSTSSSNRRANSEDFSSSNVVRMMTPPEERITWEQGPGDLDGEGIFETLRIRCEELAHEAESQRQHVADLEARLEDALAHVADLEARLEDEERDSQGNIVGQTVRDTDSNGNVVTANYRVTQDDGSGTMQDDAPPLDQGSIDPPPDSDIMQTLSAQDQPENQFIAEDQPAAREEQALTDPQVGDTGSQAAVGSQSWVSTNNDVKELDEDADSQTGPEAQRDEQNVGR